MTRIGFFIIHNGNQKCVYMRDVPFNFIDKPQLFDPDEAENNTGFPKPPFTIIYDTKNELGNYEPTYLIDEEGEYIDPENGFFIGSSTFVITEIKPFSKIEGMYIGKTSMGGGDLKIEGWLLLKKENITIEDNDNPNSSASKEKEFNAWFEDYYFNILSKEDDFLSHFNTDRTYVLIAQDNENVMGLLTIKKGSTDLNLLEHDYRNIINKNFPDIREEFKIPDELFGGYDDDSGFNMPPEPIDDSFGGNSGDDDFTVDTEYEATEVNYIVSINTDAESVELREGPGNEYPIINHIDTHATYTIVAEYNNFGKLESGAGWIDLNYTTKLEG